MVWAVEEKVMSSNLMTVKLSVSLGPQLCQGHYIQANSVLFPQLSNKIVYMDYFIVILGFQQ